MNVYLGLQLLYDAVLAIVCTYAVRRGGTPERLGAAIAVGASGLTVLVVVVLKSGWQSRTGPFLVDASALVGLGMLAFRTDRFWPLWATAFQTIAVVTHAAMLTEPDRVLQAYVLLQGFWAYPILASLALGTRGRRAASSVRRSSDPLPVAEVRPVEKWSRKSSEQAAEPEDR